MAKKDINRIKIVLVENKRTAKWLADELGKDPATVSKWTGLAGLLSDLQRTGVVQYRVFGGNRFLFGQLE